MGQLGADVDELRRLASTLHTNAGRLRTAQESLTAAVHGAVWTGPDADHFRGRWVKDAATLTSSADRLVECARELDRQVTQQVNASNSDGFVTLHGPFGTGISIELAAGAVVTAGAIPTDIDSGASRDDRRVQDDQLTRTPPGGRDQRERERGGDFNNDWAGRSILDRYLSGGDDWTINDDPNWNDYMKSNPSLTGQLSPRAGSVAVQLYDQLTRGGSSTAVFDDTFHMDIENGEGIVGYQYLHGTNVDVGDFRMNGAATIVRTADGGYDVKINADYTWNDVIDPNGQYRTDQIKSTLAEIITLGRADPYDIHITWPGETVIHLDAGGNIVSSTGYPSK